MSMFARVNQAHKARPKYLELPVGHADLDAGATTQSLDIGDVPAGAMILGTEVLLATAFSGGSVSNLVVAIGTTGDPDAILASADLDGAAVDGQASTHTAGIAPNKRFAAATTLKALFTATGDYVSALTAGACTLRVYYAVPELAA